MNGLDRTARLFRAHRRQWVSALDLMRVGGWCSWRTRISECRTLFGMRIEHKTDVAANGTRRSLYRYVGKTA